MTYRPSAQLIRFLREQAGHTQHQLAERLDTSQVQVSRWENDESRMEPHVWREIEEEYALGRRRSGEKTLSYVLARAERRRSPMNVTFFATEDGKVGRVVGVEWGHWAQALAETLVAYRMLNTFAVPTWRSGIGDVLAVVPSTLPGVERVIDLNPPSATRNFEMYNIAASYMRDIIAAAPRPKVPPEEMAA